jgi:4-hydroxy-tetrahydrodipicolinate synthase
MFEYTGLHRILCFYERHIMLPQLITAAITPFTAGGSSVDAPAFSSLLAYLYENASQGVLLFGSTGEAPTLHLEEKLRMLDLAHGFKRSLPKQDLHIMATVNSNNTAEACSQAEQFTKERGENAAESLLVVVPYYNKPTQAGLIEHFAAIAKAVPHVPLIIYNNPGRSGIRVEASTMRTLHERYPNEVVGVKQSMTCMDAFSEMRAMLPETFYIWSGEDSLTLPMLSLGAYGAISVSSHLVGRESLAMIKAYQSGHVAEALRLHQHMLPVFKGLFETTNPILAKACMAKLGFCQPDLRLPLLFESDVHTPMAERLIAFTKP